MYEYYQAFLSPFGFPIRSGPRSPTYADVDNENVLLSPRRARIQPHDAKRLIKAGGSLYTQSIVAGSFPQRTLYFLLSVVTRPLYTIFTPIELETCPD